MDSSWFKGVAQLAIDDIANYHDTVSSRRVVSAVQPGYLQHLLPSSAPQDPEPFDLIRADIHDKIMPGITHWASPGFMAFFPCSRSYPADVAEMYSNAFNGAHFNWICSPAVTELETIVLDWVAQALGLPECFMSGGTTQGGGVIHGSASEAILTVMVAARERYIAAKVAALPKDGEHDEEIWRLKSKLVALGSAGAHSSTKKAAQVLGVRFATVPIYESDGFAMMGQSLAQTIEELTRNGLEPFFLTATMGTTDFAAVDDFASIATVIRRRNNDNTPEIFVHVDAAYAGSALLLAENQHFAKHFVHFHSFNFNPHKWMLTTSDCSATFVRSRQDLVNALSIYPPYLRNSFSDNGLVTDYRDWQIPLGRRFRSLKLWLVLRSYGIRGLQEHILNGINMGTALEAKLRQREDLFRIFTSARFALLTFRITGKSQEEINMRTEKLYEAVNMGGLFFLTSTVVNDKFVIRVCTGTASVRQENVQALFETLVREAQLLM